MNVEYLGNRQEVVERATALTSKVNREWFGMGRTAAWVDTEGAFGTEVRKKLADGVMFRVIVSVDAGAETHIRTWVRCGAQVALFEHGFIRLLIFDDADAIIAYPKVVLASGVDREYFGWHIHGERETSELRNYFKQLWDAADPISDIDDLHPRLRTILLKTFWRLLGRAPEVVEKIPLPPIQLLGG